MTRTTMKAVTNMLELRNARISELETENSQLRALLATTIREEPKVNIGVLAARYCEMHGLKSVTREQLRSEGLIP